MRLANCAAASFYWSFRVRPIFTTTSLKNNENNDTLDQDNDESSLTNADKIETIHTDDVELNDSMFNVT